MSSEQDRTRGTANNLGGKIKEGMGKLTGDRDLEAGQAQLKDLREHAQVSVPLDDLVETLKEKLL